MTSAGDIINGSLRLLVVVQARTLPHAFQKLAQNGGDVAHGVDRPIIQLHKHAGMLAVSLLPDYGLTERMISHS